MRTIWGQATIYMTQNAVGWSADGRRIAAGGFNGCVATAALSDAGQRVALAGFMGLGDTWRYGIPAWSPDGAEIALRLDGIDRLRILNLVDASRRSVFAADYAPVVTWSPDGARLAVLDEPTTIWSRDLTTKLAEANLSNKASRYAQWSPSGRLIAASGGGETGLLDPNTMEFTRLWQGWETGHGVFNFAWSADERLLVISREKQILFYDVAARKPIETVNAHESFIQWLALSPDERLIASAAKDGTVRVFEVASRQRLASRTFESPATTLAFSPDGSLLACGGQQACWLLDAKLGQIVHELEGRADALAFSADGKQLLGIAVDGGRRRWDVASGKRLAEDVAHPTLCSPQKLKWSPDRRYVAAWVEGLALHVWRTADAQPMGAIGVLNDDVLYVSREGHYRTTLEAQKDLVYVALTEAGEQQLHTPEGFEKQYGWKNDPAKVRPLADPAAEPGRHDATPQSPVSGGNRSESGGSEDSRD